MSLPLSPVSPDAPAPGQDHRQVPRRFKRWQIWLLVVILVVVVATVWQLLYKQQNSMTAGRPLSYPQTHLHTVVISSRPDTVYLGTHYGLFTSTNGGQTWPQSKGALNTSMITGIAVSPTNPELLAVLAIPTSGFGRSMGIDVSADGGKSWRFTLPANLPAVAYPYAIQSAPGVQGHFYAFFTSAGWFETQDLGLHWQSITSGTLANIQTPTLLTDPTNPQYLLMGGDLGLFETRNDGQSWQQVTAVQGSVAALVATTPTASQPGTVFAATDQGLYRWQEGQTAITQLSNFAGSAAPTRLVLSSNGSALYALSGSNLWFSANLGGKWTQRWHFTRRDLTALVMNPANASELLAGFFAPGLVLISNDAGKTWQTLTN
jgi:hypothetical protein